MSTLAIKGHTTRGKEVIEILGILGGINIKSFGHIGNNPSAIYYVNEKKSITCFSVTAEKARDYAIFTLEEFLEKFPYKIGDKVKNVKMNDDIGRITNARWDSGENQIIYTVEWDRDASKRTLFYFARNLKPYIEETTGNKSNLLHQLRYYFDNTPRDVVEKEWHEYDKYNEIGPKVNAYLEYVNNIRQSKYPKTYNECCDALLPGEENFADCIEKTVQECLFGKEETMGNNINYCQVGKITAVCVQDTNYGDKVEIQLGNNYEIKEENGKYYAVKKQFKYPKTYEECYNVLGCKADYFFTDFSYNNRDVEISDYEDEIDDLLQNFRKLIYCRDAYWRIYGDEIGLDESWKPNWSKEHERKYCIVNTEGNIKRWVQKTTNKILAFPTEEMRDDFFENFEELIEYCKELL